MSRLHDLDPDPTPSQILSCSSAPDPDPAASDAEFLFESDHDALRSNGDYRALLRTLATLHAQKMKAVKVNHKRNKGIIQINFQVLMLFLTFSGPGRSVVEPRPRPQRPFGLGGETSARRDTGRAAPAAGGTGARHRLEPLRRGGRRGPRPHQHSRGQTGNPSRGGGGQGSSR